jgi:hypothetical protein
LEVDGVARIDSGILTAEDRKMITGEQRSRGAEEEVIVD